MRLRSSQNGKGDLKDDFWKKDGYTPFLNCNTYEPVSAYYQNLVVIDKAWQQASRSDFGWRSWQMWIELYTAAKRTTEERIFRFAF